ncbi:hypothetical protein M413DRAFT_32291 [Hebeloma cylindrosporum]|uniref:Uncharacterized protein n=1 Tax=Hebeloma cylindrosporum TaxID=76867 RepID=A0A0C3BUJ7_HEBCY|nr:hypothetical protein M413DRAFT_32291 [Hebeloma cylindrosporum h7]
MELVRNLRNVVLNKAQSPARSLLSIVPVPFHRTLLQIIFFCTKQTRYFADDWRCYRAPSSRSNPSAPNLFFAIAISVPVSGQANPATAKALRGFTIHSLDVVRTGNSDERIASRSRRLRRSRALERAFRDTLDPSSVPDLQPRWNSSRADSALSCGVVVLRIGRLERPSSDVGRPLISQKRDMLAAYYLHLPPYASHPQSHLYRIRNLCP